MYHSVYFFTIVADSNHDGIYLRTRHFITGNCMKKIALCLVMLATTVCGQNGEENARFAGLDFSFNRYDYQNIQGLNGPLSTVDAGRVNQQQYSWGLGLVQSVGKAVQYYDFDMQYLINDYREGKELSTRMRMLNFSLGLGYPLIGRERFSFIPRINLGVRQVILDIKENGLNEISWSDLADNKKTAFSVYASAITLSAGLRLEYYILHRESEEARISIPLSFELSYHYNVFTLTAPSLLSADPGTERVSGGPALLQNGFRISLSFGFRGILKETRPVFYN